jgi:hypothetical protein
VPCQLLDLLLVFSFSTMPTQAQPSVVDTPGARKRDLAAIHMAKAALGWDDSTYRDILFTCCGVKSSATLDFTGRKRFLDHLKQCGWAGGTSRRPSPQKALQSPLNARQGKIWSLWQQLVDAGVVKSRTKASLNKFVARQTGVSEFTWLNDPQAGLVVDSLESWLARTRPMHTTAPKR